METLKTQLSLILFISFYSFVNRVNTPMECQKRNKKRLCALVAKKICYLKLITGYKLKTY